MCQERCVGIVGGSCKDEIVRNGTECIFEYAGTNPNGEDFFFMIWKGEVDNEDDTYQSVVDNLLVCSVCMCCILLVYCVVTMAMISGVN